MNTDNIPSKCWVVGTHLDAFDAEQRRSEIRTLLNFNKKDDDSDADVPVLVMGDFNQQRSQDYTEQEWMRITDSADLRNVPWHDGVSRILLEEQDFRCVLDDVRITTMTEHPIIANDTDDDTDDFSDIDADIDIDAVRCNWNKNQPPQSTHWSGTTIDYTYYYNARKTKNSISNSNSNSSNSSNTASSTTIIAPHSVYVSAAGFSDHRMTVTDWNLNTTASASTSGNKNDAPQPRHIDKSFFFRHLPEGRHHSWLYNYNYKNNVNINEKKTTTDTDSISSTTTTTSTSTTSSLSLSSGFFSSSEFSIPSSSSKSKSGDGVEELKNLFRME